MSMKKVDVHTKKEKGGRMHVHKKKKLDRHNKKKGGRMHVHTKK